MKYIAEPTDISGATKQHIAESREQYFALGKQSNILGAQCYIKDETNQNIVEAIDIVVATEQHI